MFKKALLCFVFIVLGLSLIIGCSEKKAVVLNCDETEVALVGLTNETSLLFNDPLINDATKAFNAYCKSKKIISISECEKESTSDNVMYCKMAYGAKADSYEECNSDDFCLNAYATSHIGDCSLFADLKLGRFPLENICRFASASFYKDSSYCEDISMISLSSPECYYGSGRGEECDFSKNKCLWIVSDQNNDLTICEFMADSPEKDICILSYAMKNSKIELCEGLKGNLLNGSLVSVETCEALVKNPTTHNLIKGGILNNLNRPDELPEGGFLD